MTNVIAGPNCARMLAELCASVLRIEQPAPNHPPLAMTSWGAEAGSGKQSIILDTDTPDGREVLGKLLRRTDFVVANKGDAQCKHLGIDPASWRSLKSRRF
jgi:crotonobetainyl-CoA:carnitine CoA-transferase CaiB-like acyl-CoA transferase